MHLVPLLALTLQFMQLGRQRSIDTLLPNTGLEENLIGQFHRVTPRILLNQIPLKMMLIGRYYLLHEQQITVHINSQKSNRQQVVYIGFVIFFRILSLFTLPVELLGYQSVLG